MKLNTIISLAFAFITLTSSANAASVKLTFVDKALPEKMTLLAISQSGAVKTAKLASGAKNGTINISGTSQLFLRRANGSVVGIVSLKCAASGKGCNSKKVAPYVKKGTFSVTGVKSINSTPLLIATISKASDYKSSVDTSVTYTKATFLKDIKAHGAKINGISSRALVGTRALSIDKDGDGIPDPLDVDNDGDGTLDNYDKDSSDKGGSVATSTFTLFSNFKASIESSINYNTTGLSTTLIDNLMRTIQTLAIQVSGSPSDTNELDCGALSYCSAGGTGTTAEVHSDFPGSAGGANDPDGDGLGTITRGSTGDFQLSTGATSSAINGGNTLIEYVTSSSSGTVTPYTGTLNFVFVSNPAVYSVAVNSDPAQIINYSSHPILGENNNCVTVPATGPVSLTITGWRPQRPGNSTAGEAEYVDLGNSLITFDIPNRPCSLSGGGGCASQGPGNCRASVYSSTDPHISSDSNGLKDTRGDVDVDPTNTYTFTADVVSCLNLASGGAISWNPGETLFIDLQFKSEYGDNAAQKFCVKRLGS